MNIIYENIFSKFTHIVCNHFRYGLRNNGFKIKAGIKIKDLYDVLMVLIYQSYIFYSKIMHSPLQKNPQKIKQNNKQTKSEKKTQAIITLM